jgi:hypothetical protein
MFRRNASNLTELTKVLISYPTEPYREIKAMVKYETKKEEDFYVAAAGALGDRLKDYEDMVSEDNILTLLTLLRLLSSHPAAFVKAYNKRYSDAPIKPWKGTVSKFNMIEAQLRNYYEEGESCIVFVHFYQEANGLAISAEIAKLSVGYKNIEFINGTVSMEDREYICHDSKRIIEAGGTYLIIANINSCSEGVNLQFISRVIICSINWNPQQEAQTIGRCYRIGSKRPVTVNKYYHQVIENLSGHLNIDQYMKDKQKYKKALATELIDELLNAAWSWKVSNIPDYDVSSCIFPKPEVVRRSITQAPGTKPVKTTIKATIKRPTVNNGNGNGTITIKKNTNNSHVPNNTSHVSNNTSNAHNDEEYNCKCADVMNTYGITKEKLERVNQEIERHNQIVQAVQQPATQSTLPTINHRSNKSSLK